jgi:hypothetical protein
VTASLCYAYCVLPGGALPDEPSAGGVGDVPVTVVHAERLALAVSTVPADVFDEARLASRLEDPDWTSRLAMAHFDVVNAFFAAGPVLPLRLCTLFRSTDRAVATVDAQTGPLESALARVDGCGQWSVTARLGSRPSARDGEAVSSGAEYLRRVAARRQDEADAMSAGQAAARTLHETLSRVAVATEPGTAGADGAMQSAYLVRAADAERFLRAADTFDADRHLDVEVRGPWAPYSFVPRLVEAA